MMKKINIPFFIIKFWFVCGILALILPLQPDQIELNKILLGPNLEQWCGYDHLGRPICERLIMGAKTSLSVAIVVVLISFIVGTFFGVICAWLGGIYDKFLVAMIDIFISFPGILLAIVLAGLLGPGLANTVIALSIVSWVGFSRLARIQTLSIKNRDHIINTFTLSSNDEKEAEYVLHCHLDRQLFFGALNRDCVWNLVLSGQIVIYERIPNIFNPNITFSLNFLVVDNETKLKIK